MQSFIFLIFGILIGFVVGGDVKELSIKGKREINKEDSVADDKEESSIKSKTLSDKEEKILKLFEKKKKISTNDIEKLFKIKEITAKKYLKKLENEGIVVLNDKQGKTSNYSLK